MRSMTICLSSFSRNATDAGVDLSLVKLPEGALMFPRINVGLTTPRKRKELSRAFAARATKLGFKIRLHDLRGTQNPAAGIGAARCGHDPATLLRTYAKRRKTADTGPMPSEGRRPTPLLPLSSAPSPRACSKFV
jgi:hypothetical protein